MIYCKRAAPLQPPGQTDALNLSRLYSMMEVSGKMTARRHRIKSAVMAAVFGGIVLFVLLFPHQEYIVIAEPDTFPAHISAEFSSDEARAITEQLEQLYQALPADAATGPVILRRSRSVLGGAEMEVTVPYMQAAIRDTGTGGSSDWSVWLGFLSATLGQDGYTLGRLPSLDRLSVRVTADDNTFLGTGPGGRVFSASLEEMSPTEAGYAVGLRAATKTSSIAPNQPTAAAVVWEGVLKASPFSGGQPFSLRHSYPYTNNIISSPGA